MIRLIGKKKLSEKIKKLEKKNKELEERVKSLENVLRSNRILDKPKENNLEKRERFIAKFCGIINGSEREANIKNIWAKN